MFSTMVRSPKRRLPQERINFYCSARELSDYCTMPLLRERSVYTSQRSVAIPFE